PAAWIPRRPGLGRADRRRARRARPIRPRDPGRPLPPDQPRIRLSRDGRRHQVTRRARLILCGAAAVVAAGLLAATVTYFTGAKAAGLPAVGRVIPAAPPPPGPGISG